jgi:hypothetical protein
MCIDFKILKFNVSRCLNKCLEVKGRAGWDKYRSGMHRARKCSAHSGAFFAGCGLLHHELRAFRNFALAVGVEALLLPPPSAADDNVSALLEPDAAAGLRLSRIDLSLVSLTPLDNATTVAADDSDTGGAHSELSAARTASTLPPPAAFFKSISPRSRSTMWRADTTRLDGDRKLDTSIDSMGVPESATRALAPIAAGAEAAVSGSTAGEEEEEDEDEEIYEEDVDEEDVDEKCKGSIDNENAGAGKDAVETMGGVKMSRCRGLAGK